SGETGLGGGAGVNWPAAQQTRTWTGTTDTDWSNAANWNTGVPGTSDNVVIPASTTFSPSLTTNVIIRDLTVASGANLSIGTFILMATGNVDAGTTITGGSTGALTMGGAGKTIKGTVPNLITSSTNLASGPLTVTGDLIVNGGSFDV